jgi:hypothetical protein
MKRTCALLLIVGTLAADPLPAHADFPAAMTLGTGYALGPTDWTPWWTLPETDDWLLMLGTVTAVGAPFVARLPTSGPWELTYVVSSLTCEFSGWGEDLVCNAGYDAFYQNGVLTVYLDQTPDADFANPGTFADGEVVLVARLGRMHLGMHSSCMYGDATVQEASLTFDSGSWFDLVSRHGTGYAGENVGEFDGDVPAALKPAGYIGRSNSIINIAAPVATQPVTWGAVKALYR